MRPLTVACTRRLHSVAQESGEFQWLASWQVVCRGSQAPRWMVVVVVCTAEQTRLRCVGFVNPSRLPVHHYQAKHVQPTAPNLSAPLLPWTCTHHAVFTVYTARTHPSLQGVRSPSLGGFTKLRISKNNYLRLPNAPSTALHTASQCA